jgi:hypothetical protein
MPDHVHVMISIPPKYAVSQVVGYIKGKSAIHLARVYGERKRNFVGQHFWARGYFVSTVGRDEVLKKRSATTSASRRKRMPDWSSSISRVRPPSGGATIRGRVSDSMRPLRAAHNPKASGYAGGTYIATAGRCY